VRLTYWLCAIATLAAVAVTTATAARAPLPEQRRELSATLKAAQGNVIIHSVLISSANPSYAVIRWSQVSSTVWEDLFRRGPVGWKIIWIRELTQNADGACAFSPHGVVKDLFRLVCPPDRAVHARRATVAERAALSHALAASPLTRQLRNPRLEGVCVSRLDRHWAALIAAFPNTGQPIWFRYTAAAWHVVYEAFAQKGTRPPHNIVLSLASCVGYNAALYGG
jgi:hypothetical protein